MHLADATGQAIDTIAKEPMQFASVGGKLSNFGPCLTQDCDRDNFMTPEEAKAMLGSSNRVLAGAFACLHAPFSQDYGLIDEITPTKAFRQPKFCTCCGHGRGGSQEIHSHGQAWPRIQKPKRPEL